MHRKWCQGTVSMWSVTDCVVLQTKKEDPQNQLMATETSCVTVSVLTAGSVGSGTGLTSLCVCGGGGGKGEVYLHS